MFEIQAGYVVALLAVQIGYLVVRFVMRGYHAAILGSILTRVGLMVVYSLRGWNILEQVDMAFWGRGMLVLLLFSDSVNALMKSIAFYKFNRAGSRRIVADR